MTDAKTELHNQKANKRKKKKIEWKGQRGIEDRTGQPFISKVERWLLANMCVLLIMISFEIKDAEISN